MHYNSSRTGVRLIGPKPQWARRDGGEAGLHPSNIHDNAYAVGAIDYTGDMPVILGPDGPSLGGFVCPVTIARAELWKMGQLKAGDRVRFRAVSLDEARALERTQERDRPDAAGARGREARRAGRRAAAGSAILRRDEARADVRRWSIRRDGDANLLVEYGPPVLDLGLRLRVHALMQALGRAGIAGHPRSHAGHPLAADPLRRSARCRANGCSRSCDELEADLPRLDEIEVPSRDRAPAALLGRPGDAAGDREVHAARCAPTRPGARATSSSSAASTGSTRIDEVQRIVFDASYLVLGLGDVYLGAPVATPLDPRHRLVTTKYNPARTWTPENAVGIGGAYLCVYGMEGPGGYQFVGRTCQMWNTLPRRPRTSPDGKP